jgi:hypothetical protein
MRSHPLSNSQRAWLFVVLCLGAIGLLNVFATNTASTVQRLLASLVIGVSLVPACVYLYRREANIPYLPIWGVIYGIYYGLPIFILDDFRMRLMPLSDAAITDALLVALIGAGLLFIAFYAVPTGARRLVPRLSLTLEPRRAEVGAVLISSVGLIATLVGEDREHSAFDAIFSFVAQWPLLGLAVLYLLFLRKELGIVSKLYLWLVLLPLLLVKDLGTGFMTNPLRDFLLLFFLHWAVRRRIPLKAIAICLLLITPLFAAKQGFRDVAWFGGDQNQGLIEKGLTFVNMGWEALVRFGDDEKGALVDQTGRRTANLLVLGAVVQMTPYEVPYWEGETYSTLPTTLIPRFLWPEKPEKNLGQDFGHRYGFLDDEDYGTSVNLPQLVELYANFGWLGVLLGMPLIGVIYRMVYEMVNHVDAGSGGFAIAGLMFVSLANIESDFSLVFGGILQLIVACVVLVTVLGGVREFRFSFRRKNLSVAAA